MDYLKTIVPSQLMAERGSNLVVINPGSENVRVGLAHHRHPFNIPHCVARYVSKSSRSPNGLTVRDEMINSHLSSVQCVERQKALNDISSALLIQLMEGGRQDHFLGKTGSSEGSKNCKADAPFNWTNVIEEDMDVCFDTVTEECEIMQQDKNEACQMSDFSKYRYRDTIFGEEALRILPSEPYCISHPIRRGHFNVSHGYPVHQVLEDVYAIWNWVLSEELHISPDDRIMFSAVLVVPETFDNREIKEMLSIVLRDLKFNTAVVHQESLAAAFGSGLSTACIVNLGAQVTSVVCIEDGVVLPPTGLSMPYGGEDISRCFFWLQQHLQTWPSKCTNPLGKPIDMLVLNTLKESYCQIKEDKLDVVADFCLYEDVAKSMVGYKTCLCALNVPPMGLFFPHVLAADQLPSPPRAWFHDYEDMLEETCHMEYPGLIMCESYPVFRTRLMKDEKLDLAEAITSSIMSTGRIDLQRKLFCSILLIGGVGLTAGLIPAMEERVLQAIPSHEAIDTVEVLQPRSNPAFVSWAGGAILGVLDFGRDAWIHREDWIRNGIHIGSGRKYKDSFFLQAQAMCYLNN